MEILTKVYEWFVHLSTGGMLTTIAMIVEFMLRMVKTSKPLSMLYVFRDGVQMAAKIFGVMVEILDKVLPQRVK